MEEGPEENARPTATHAVCTVEPNAVEGHFPLIDHLTGPNESYLKFIREQTGTSISLKGTYKLGGENHSVGQCTDKALHFELANEDPLALDEAKAAAHSLIQTTAELYRDCSRRAASKLPPLPLHKLPPAEGGPIRGAASGTGPTDRLLRIEAILNRLANTCVLDPTSAGLLQAAISELAHAEAKTHEAVDHADVSFLSPRSDATAAGAASPGHSAIGEVNPDDPVAQQLLADNVRLREKLCRQRRTLRAKIQAEKERCARLEAHIRQIQLIHGAATKAPWHPPSN